MIKTIYFDNDSVMLLDQNKLPGQTIYERCTSPEDVANAIKKLKVRGAPLIGVAAAFGIAMAVNNYSGLQENLDEYFSEVKELLVSTRPTAVNLFWALVRMENVYNQNSFINIEEIASVLMKEAQEMYHEDIKMNEAIGKYGEELLSENNQVMTICNAGSLATCGYGTALGVIRSAAKNNKISKVWACETRPVLQGARLTVWELMQDKIPVTLITDNMAGYIMSLGNIDAVVVGADRIAANGDTANKIGTYTLAVLADYHKIPFYVAAPFSTVDMDIDAGIDIPIEERERDEVRKIKDVYLTVPDVEVFNPAFDVTPNKLITAIITEKGIIKPPFKEKLESLNEKGGI